MKEKLKTAIKDYKNKDYSIAFNSFKNISTSVNSSTEISDNATYYVALCYMHGNGTEQNRQFAIEVAKDFQKKIKNYHTTIPESDKRQLVVITGATGDIGFNIAKAFLKYGYKKYAIKEIQHANSEYLEEEKLKREKMKLKQYPIANCLHIWNNLAKSIKFNCKFHNNNVIILLNYIILGVSENPNEALRLFNEVSKSNSKYKNKAKERLKN
ncbi:hypothetical protein C2G38_2284398 [Gigaspora rosea]|uniref:Uncharacterized protein n=1 Tax=Gigaspora rosea TaxID=44941 RepID=A0A397VPC6_9GLOM|nr:hypothetical protein C2G38_2284398 [Gigaspora rosea]